ncbi:hypothetical protein QE152_g5124 [Popillia japonica]|uniref:Uncharacterized protein n=1 Tax=Popillia japonica TaxID=7064 RepID=A0AAW1MZJ6_POPJA
MSDITDVEKRDKLLENVRVSLQGRPPTTLKYLTDGNKELIKTFSTMDVMKLMKPRNLYLKPSCLDGSNNLAFFIKDPNCTSESTMEAPYEMGDLHSSLKIQIAPANQQWKLHMKWATISRSIAILMISTNKLKCLKINLNMTII